jgi:hypothetical protein
MPARFKFTRIAVGFLSAVFLLSTAKAQVPQQFLRMFNPLWQLQQRQQQFHFQRPTPPVSTFPQIDRSGASNISSSRPTIDCSKLKTPLGLILCADENAARADWDVNASAWAYAFTLEEGPRKAFWQSQDEWVQSVTRKCNLTVQIWNSQRECVVMTYRARANALRSKLTGDALAETKLLPEQRAAIQAKLAASGFLADRPDGEFGANTRAAIKKFQQANGYREAAFLTAGQRQTLLGSAQVSQSPAQTQVTQTPERLAEPAKPAVPTVSSQSTEAQYVQQAKLVGSSGIGYSNQGKSVALSADGDTAIVGGPNDNFGNPGAAWVFTRSTAGVWTQQEHKLIGSGAVGFAGQGDSVALSADGNTAIVGGDSDNDSVGAAWVFTRKDGVWTQQGPKLVGSGAVGKTWQGWSVALSADGNTAIVGGPRDNEDSHSKAVGATWVFTRTGGVWTQQGPKLVGSGAVGRASQGTSVSLSADGNIALVGGPSDNDSRGAAWVFTRSGGVWTQQSKLSGAGAVIEPERDSGAGQGESVALSADGNTAIIGGPWDSWPGAAWVFVRTKGAWAQQGSKLVGTGSVGTVGPMGASILQGFSVALSGDGDTAIIGGTHDRPHGAAWIFVRKDGIWSQFGSKLVGTVVPSSNGIVSEGFSVALSANGQTALVGGVGDSNIGAAWVFSKLSIAPPAHDPIAQYNDETVCRSALTSDTLDQWEQNPEYLAYVTEARRRGYSVDTCRQKVPEASPNPTASAQSLINVPAEGMCRGALNSLLTDWDRNSNDSEWLAEAHRRGYTVDTCRQMLALPPRELGIPPGPESNRSALIKGVAAVYVFDKFCTRIPEGIRRAEIVKSVQPWIVENVNAERQEQDAWLASIDPAWRPVWCALMRRSTDELLSIPLN